MAATTKTLALLLVVCFTLSAVWAVDVTAKDVENSLIPLWNQYRSFVTGWVSSASVSASQVVALESGEKITISPDLDTNRKLFNCGLPDDHKLSVMELQKVENKFIAMTTVLSGGLAEMREPQTKPNRNGIIQANAFYKYPDNFSFNFHIPIKMKKASGAIHILKSVLVSLAPLDRKEVFCYQILLF